QDGANFYDRPDCTENDIRIYPTFFLISSDKKVDAFWEKLEHLSRLGRLEVTGRFYANQDKFGNRLDMVDAKLTEPITKGQ
ncbi:MAG: hypothetical protein M3362_18960, partial [Acidobacteriota bacterium]|nr:hypothetical protein [Acidobacteriota bacterium]